MSLNTTYPSHTVAVYNTHEKAESAIKLLSEDGFNMNKLSIIGQNYETKEQPVGFINTGDRMISWGSFGAFWGSIWGLLWGSAMLFIPGVGFIMFAGYIVAAIEGAAIVGGIAALAAALGSIGIPKDSVVLYDAELKAGKFILLAHGDEAETSRAKDILSSTAQSDLQWFSRKPAGVGSMSS